MNDRTLLTTPDKTVIVNDTEMVYTVPDAAINNYGQIEIIGTIRNILRRELDTPWEALEYEDLIAKFLTDTGPQAWNLTVKDAFQGYRGKFTQRLSRWVHNTYAYDLSEAELAYIGRDARNYNTGGSYRVRFTDEFDWDSGDYGDDGSCFWGSRSDARIMLADAGGLAVLISGSSYARAWVMPQHPTPGNFTIFNGYGLSTPEIANILNNVLDLKSAKLKLSNGGLSVGTLWINDNRLKDGEGRLTPFSGHGFVFASPDAVLPSTPHDFMIPDVRIWKCEYCDKPLTDRTDFGDGYTTQENVRRIDVTVSNVRHICCKSCYDTRFEECYNCGSREVVGVMTETVDDHRVCNRCYSAARVCSHCNRRTFDINEHDEVLYCNECYNGLFDRCPTCSSFVLKSTIATISVQVGVKTYRMCPECVSHVYAGSVQNDGTRYFTDEAHFNHFARIYDRLHGRRAFSNNVQLSALDHFPTTWPQSQPSGQLSFGDYISGVTSGTISSFQGNFTISDNTIRSYTPSQITWATYPTITELPSLPNSNTLPEEPPVEPDGPVDEEDIPF